MVSATPDDLPLAGSVRRWAATGIASRETLRRAIARGELRASQPSRRLVVLREHVFEWLERYPARSRSTGGGDEAGGPLDALANAREIIGAEVARRFAQDLPQPAELARVVDAIDAAVLALSGDGA